MPRSGEAELEENGVKKGHIGCLVRGGAGTIESEVVETMSLAN